MPEYLLAYQSAFLALGLLGLLSLVQLLIADFVGIFRRHTPGTPVKSDHSDLLFRAHRAHANTNETLGAVILLSAFAILRNGDPSLVQNTLWTFLALRFLHMLAYYFDLRIARSVVFALSFLALLVLFGIGVLA